MDKAEVINKLHLYKTELNKHINLKKMYLFGSYSKNLQKSNSDIDVAIFVDKIQGDYLKYLTLVWKLGGDFDSRIEPIVIEEGQPDYSGFYKTIIQTGIEIN